MNGKSRVLEDFTNEELNEFMREREARDLIPNIDKSIEITQKLMDIVEKDLVKYPVRINAAGTYKEMVLNYLNGNLKDLKDAKSRLMKEFGKSESKP